jgi:hypothetical protein
MGMLLIGIGVVLFSAVAAFIVLYLLIVLTAKILGFNL